MRGRRTAATRVVSTRVLHDGCVDGRFRKRTWLRKRLPSFLVGRGVAAKGRTDCGNHEWYKASDAEDRCYHCPVGVRRRSQFPTIA